MVYTNDLMQLLARYNIKVKLFADDVKLLMLFMSLYCMKH